MPPLGKNVIKNLIEEDNGKSRVSTALVFVIKFNARLAGCSNSYPIHTQNFKSLSNYAIMYWFLSKIEYS